jgi:uncharacterized membrane protein
MGFAAPSDHGHRGLTRGSRAVLAIGSARPGSCLGYTAQLRISSAPCGFGVGYRLMIEVIPKPAVLETFVPCIDNPTAHMDYPEPMTVMQARSNRLEGRLEGLVWVLFMVHLIAQPVYSLLPKDLEMAGTLFIVVTSTAFAFSHLYVSQGARAAITMLLLCFVIAGSLEMLSVQTGFPYGWYSYSSKLGPGLAGVPLLVPLCWQMMAWNALSVAKLIVPKRWPKAAIILIAALALTAWDVFLDPQMVRAGLWTWARQGEYVGIPLENYLGWLFTALILFAAFSRLTAFLSDERTKEEKRLKMKDESKGSRVSLLSFVFPRSSAVDSRLTWFAILPVLSYVWTWFGSSIVNVFWWGQPVVGLAGFIAMGLFAVPALKILLESPLLSNTLGRK